MKPRAEASQAFKSAFRAMILAVAQSARNGHIVDPDNLIEPFFREVEHKAREESKP
jgi:hypothetical protein